MELRRYLSVLRRRLALILLTAIVAMTVAFATAPHDKNYVAVAKILVGPQQFSGGSAANSVSNDVLTGFERITATFSLLIKSRPVAAAAVDTTGLQRSADSVTGAINAFAVPNTQLLFVSVSDPDPTVARDLTNAVVDAFVAKVAALRPGQEGAIPFAPVYVFERAQLPTAPNVVSSGRNVVVAGLFGAFAAASLGFLLEYLDITVKTAADVERRLQLPVLGVVPRDRIAPEGHGSRLLALAREGA